MISSEPMPASKPTRPLDWARESGTVEAVLENMSAKLKKRRQRRIKSGTRIGSLVLLIAFGIWLVPFLRDTDSVQTSPAQRQTLALADGSAAELNARTTLKTDFRYGRRVVELECGEAFFSVVSDPAHPFIVKTPAGAVRVTGTKFNVRLNADGAGTVTLVEGAVTIRQGGAGRSIPDIAVRPNEQVVFDATHARTQVLTETQIANELAWRSGRLVLESLTLADAVRRFAEYHGTQIRIDGSVGTFHMGGSCPLDDLAGFLDFIEETLPVNVVSDGSGAYLIAPK